MNVTFYGAVTRSHRIHAPDLQRATTAFVLDCGLFQGRRKESAEKNRSLPLFQPAPSPILVLSHAHIDHSGRIPLLVTKRLCWPRYLYPGHPGRLQLPAAGFGPYSGIGCQLPQLQNCARRLLSQARNPQRPAPGGERTEAAELETQLLKQYGTPAQCRKDQRNHPDPQTSNAVDPLCTAWPTPRRPWAAFDGYPYRLPVTVGRKGASCTFYEAGHILGIRRQHPEASKATDGPGPSAITGDIGRFNKPIIRNPANDFAPEHREVDLMIMESTYGDRLHEPVQRHEAGPAAGSLHGNL